MPCGTLFALYAAGVALSAGSWLAYNPYLPVMALFGLPGRSACPVRRGRS